MKVFLGGTCNDSTWRDELIPLLKIDYFNPVVEKWTEDHQKEEIKQRQTCDYCLYVITPKRIGTYTIAEAVDDSNKRPKKTIVAIIQQDKEYMFNTSQWNSMVAVIRLCHNNGAYVLNNPDMIHLSDFINDLAAGVEK